MRILTIRLSALGDVLRVFPSLKALRKKHPEAHITHLVDERAASLMVLCPHVDDVLVMPRKGVGLGTILGLKRGEPLTRWRSFKEKLTQPEQPWDLVVDFHGLLKSGYLTRLAKGIRKVGFKKPHSREASHLFYPERAPGPSNLPASRFERNASMLDHLEVPRACWLPDDLRINSADDVLARDWCNEMGFTKPPLFFWPGTSEAQAHKRWSLDGYRRVSELARQAGWPVIIGWGPAESKWLAPWLDHLAEGEYRIPDLRFPALAPLIRRCAAFLGGDTGPMHLAGLAGVPSAIIYGPTSPVTNRSWIEQAKLSFPDEKKWQDITCRPIVTDHLKNLDGDRVWQELKIILDR